MRNNRTILLQSLLVFAFILVACAPKTEGSLPDEIKLEITQLGDVCAYVIKEVPEGSIASFEVPGNQLAPAEHADSKGKIEGGWAIENGKSCKEPSTILLEMLSAELETGYEAKYYYLIDEDNGGHGDGEYGYMSRGSQK